MTVRASNCRRVSQVSACAAISAISLRIISRSVRSSGRFFSDAGRPSLHDWAPPCARRCVGSCAAVGQAAHRIAQQLDIGDAQSTRRSMPRARSFFAVTGQTPHNASTGSCCRNGSTRPGLMTVRPSASSSRMRSSRGTCFGATPATRSGPVSARMRSFKRFATAVPSVSPQAFLVTSNTPRERQHGSTQRRHLAEDREHGVRGRLVFREVGRHITATGHRRTAVAIGIAENTPNLRAS